MPSTTLSRGNVLYNYLAGPSITPSSVAANTTAEQSFTVAGLQTGDQLQVSFQGSQTAGVAIVNARVSAANTLALTFGNFTSGALTPVAGVYVIEINRPESITLPTNAV